MDFDQRFEGRLRAGDAHGEGAGAGDELAEFGVGGGEVREGCDGVVGRLAGSCGVHGGSLVQLSLSGLQFFSWRVPVSVLVSGLI